MVMSWDPTFLDRSGPMTSSLSILVSEWGTLLASLLYRGNGSIKSDKNTYVGWPSFTQPGPAIFGGARSHGGELQKIRGKRLSRYYLIMVDYVIK